jgi:hypothetical protein
MSPGSEELLLSRGSGSLFNMSIHGAKDADVHNISDIMELKSCS